MAEQDKKVQEGDVRPASAPFGRATMLIRCGMPGQKFLNKNAGSRSRHLQHYQLKKLTQFGFQVRINSV